MTSEVVRTQVPASKIRAGHQDPGPGEHLWTLIVSYRVSDDAVKALRDGKDPEMMLDHENLISVDGPGCYKCELPFSRRLSFRRCTGSMEPQ